jgi:serine/threonine protein kinase/tetratricopeptide (TPR) repeat protein
MDEFPDSTAEWTRAASEVDLQGVGATIGPYKLLQRLGEGGFGTVFLAEQRAPMVRRVALKIIKRGMDTRQVIARFEAERQALAMMDHPNIAKVLDAGATGDGRPYFVMELVHGDPITEYCDRHILRTRDRLELFVHICHAVQHAHQKGIIHRDLKPSNVLVTIVDGHPVAKVIDFGIAKATSVPLTDKTLHTELHEAIGTPVYMSPEQAEMSGVDIDTRADIYSLGVLLYELLTGTTPLDRQQLRSAGWDGARRMIREMDPPTPSTRLRDAGATLEQIAASRDTDGGKLRSEVRGDLDWIAMKCLEKDRTRRYDTANALAMDVGRHLNGEPVYAAPPGKAYRLRKFIARNQAAVFVAAAILVLLVAGIAGTTFGLFRARAGRAEAQEQRLEAETQKDTAEQILRVFTQMLDGVKGAVAQGRDATLLREILDQTRARVEAGEFHARPAVEIALRNTIGMVYVDLGDYAQAEKTLSEAVRLARERHIGDDLQLADTLNNLGNVVAYAHRSDEALRLFGDVLAMRRRLLKGDHKLVAESLDNLGSVYRDLDRFDEAERAQRDSLVMQERLSTRDEEQLATTKDNLAQTLLKMGRTPEAETRLRDALATRERLHPRPHPAVATSLNNLALVTNTLGGYAETEQLLRRSLAITKQVYSGDHPDIATQLTNLATALTRLGRYAEAERLYREGLPMHQRLFPGDNLWVQLDLINLANTLRLLQRPREGEPYARESLAMGRRFFHADHTNLVRTLDASANLMLALDRPDRADAHAREAVAMGRRLFKGDHPIAATTLDTLANVLRAAGKRPEAEVTAREALAMDRRLFKSDHPDVARTLRTVARTLGSASPEAPALADQALAMASRVLAADHPALKDYQQTVAEVKSRAGDAVPARSIR